MKNLSSTKRNKKMGAKNPRKWRFTWEAHSHTPNLKLFLFDSHTSPSIHCQNLLAHLNFSPKSHLLVSWNESDKNVFVRVPVPRVLVDPDSEVSCRALDDHIEVKLVLILPVDHPIVSSLSNLSDDFGGDDVVLDSLKPLLMDSDVMSLSATEGVHFYCRSCSTRLTRSPLRKFEETPSTNWREMADNWFGSCCCSFGGVSEKLVSRYADTYKCAKGVCLLNSTSVTLCKDDLVACKFAGQDKIHNYEPKQDFVGENDLSEDCILDVVTKSGRIADFECQNERLHGDNDLKYEVIGEAPLTTRSLCAPPASDLTENLTASRPGCCASAHHSHDYINEVVTVNMSKLSLVGEKTLQGMDLLERSILNGFLGNIFVAKSYNVSKDIEWKQFFCPQCSSLLGTYPCSSGQACVDDGVRLFKCYLSTCLPVGGSGDLFRKYTLERMLANELVESAKDELSFRSLVRDLETRSPMLQVVLLNPNSWCCTGSCLENESTMEKISKLDLQPVIKVLFADCNSNTESQSRILEGWVTKNLAEEVLMLRHLTEELIEILTHAKEQFPPSCTFDQGLYLSCMVR